jgi:hypothetical protein
VCHMNMHERARARSTRTDERSSYFVQDSADTVPSGWGVGVDGQSRRVLGYGLGPFGGAVSPPFSKRVLPRVEQKIHPRACVFRGPLTQMRREVWPQLITN